MNAKQRPVRFGCCAPASTSIPTPGSRRHSGLRVRRDLSIGLGESCLQGQASFVVVDSDCGFDQLCLHRGRRHSHLNITATPTFMATAAKTATTSITATTALVISSIPLP